MRLLLCMAVGLTLQSGVASAVVLDTFGDIDCFGTNETCDDGVRGAGDVFAWLDFTGDMVREATSPVTDRHTLGEDQSWTHSLAGPVAGQAELEFRTYGFADQRGPYDVTVNGTSVGTVPAVDNGSVWASQVVMNYQFLFDGALLVAGLNTVAVTQSGNANDVWALDFSQLSSVDAPVPLPASIWLLAGALGAFGAVSRRTRA